MNQPNWLKFLQNWFCNYIKSSLYRLTIYFLFFTNIMYGHLFLLFILNLHKYPFILNSITVMLMYI